MIEPCFSQSEVDPLGWQLDPGVSWFSKSCPPPAPLKCYTLLRGPVRKVAEEGARRIPFLAKRNCNLTKGVSTLLSPLGSRLPSLRAVPSWTMIKTLLPEKLCGLHQTPFARYQVSSGPVGSWEAQRFPFLRSIALFLCFGRFGL